MDVMVSLNLVTVCMFASLSVLSVAILIGLRRQSALAWLAMALLCGAAQTLTMTLHASATLQLVAASILAPAAYLCFGQAVRVVSGEKHQHWRLLSAIAGLVTLSLLLLALGAPFIWQTLPFQLAGALALGDSILRLYGSRNRGVLGGLLLLNLFGIASIFLVRIPVFPAIFDASTSYLEVSASVPEKVLMTASALLTPPAVFLLLAKLISGVIGTYRTRSEHDGLTGLLNRRAIDEAAAIAEPQGGSVIFCDLDHFKAINDRYGHQTGDNVICAFADLLRRTGTRAARIGGEEFALLLPQKSLAEAQEVAEMIRLRFSEATHPSLAANHRPSASFGVAAYAPGECAADAFTLADAALYRAKATGRNRVIAHTLDAEAMPQLNAQAA
jgi:diguanylate cyclase (GGDEF)-like protein